MRRRDCSRSQNFPNSRQTCVVLTACWVSVLGQCPEGAEYHPLPRAWHRGHLRPLWLIRGHEPILSWGESTHRLGGPPPFFGLIVAKATVCAEQRVEETATMWGLGCEEERAVQAGLGVTQAWSGSLSLSGPQCVEWG